MLGESGVDHDVLVTQHARHATESMEMIRNQKRSGDEKDVSEYDGIVMMGGDGIIMEILQGLKTQNDYDAIVDRIRFVCDSEANYAGTIAADGHHYQGGVLAAANPVYGQYDWKRRIQENIGLPNSLLSWLDLLFVVLDQLDPDTDRCIEANVIQGHMYKGGNAK